MKDAREITMYESDPALKATLRQKRVAEPNARFTSLFRYAVNTSRRRMMECVLCGAEGPTWSGEWPKTKRANDWEVEHREAHLKEIMGAAAGR